MGIRGEDKGKPLEGQSKVKTTPGSQQARKKRQVDKTADGLNAWVPGTHICAACHTFGIVSSCREAVSKVLISCFHPRCFSISLPPYRLERSEPESSAFANKFLRWSTLPNLPSSHRHLQRTERLACLQMGFGETAVMSGLWYSADWSRYSTSKGMLTYPPILDRFLSKKKRSMRLKGKHRYILWT